MTESVIQQALKWYFINYEYKLFNSFVYDWESDFFGVTKSGYAVEVEIKISRSDFKNDAKKIEKHHLLCNCDKNNIVKKTYPFNPYLRKGETEYHYKVGDASTIFFCDPKKHTPNKFFYCVPEGLITKEECPKYAGLIYYRKDISSQMITVKPAPFLHKVQNSLTGTLLSKFYHKSMNLKSELSDLIHGLDLKTDYRKRLTDFEKDKVKRILTKLL